MNAVSKLQSRGLRQQERWLTDLRGQKPTFQIRDEAGGLIAYEIPCVPSGERRGTAIEVGGIPYVVDLSLVVRLEHFLRADSGEQSASDEGTADVDLPVPQSGTGIVYRASDYKVLDVTQSGDGSGGSHLILDCADVNSGR